MIVVGGAGSSIATGAGVLFATAAFGLPAFGLPPPLPGLLPPPPFGVGFGFGFGSGFGPGLGPGPGSGPGSGPGPGLGSSVIVRYPSVTTNVSSHFVDWEQRISNSSH